MKVQNVSKKLEFQVCTLEIQKKSMKNKDMMFLCSIITSFIF